MIIQKLSKQKKNLFADNPPMKTVFRLKKKRPIYGVTLAWIPLKIRA